jgi:hypothetical protein
MSRTDPNLSTVPEESGRKRAAGEELMLELRVGRE